MFRSSIAKKVVVAVTGLVLFGYLVGHMAGNLLLFGGPGAINGYAEKLHSLGPVLWAVRLFLLAALVLHVVTTIQLWRENRAARPERYVMEKPRRSTLASRTMLVSGLIVFAFIVYHVLHFTVLAIVPEYTKFTETTPTGHRHDVFAMVTDAFRRPFVVLVYLAAMALVATHLYHGVGSLFKTLGLHGNRLGRWIDRLALAAAAVVVIGFVVVPIAVIAGLAGGK